MKPVLVFALLLIVPVAQAKKLSVQIVDHHESNEEFTVSYPGYGQSNCSISAYSNQAYVNCSETNSSATASSYTVRGFVLTLQLPDARRVLVTCEKKTNWSEWNAHWYRPCRHPLTASVDANFESDNAKLEWSVSLDGKKKQRETYKIIAVLSPIRSDK